MGLDLQILMLLLSHQELLLKVLSLEEAGNLILAGPTPPNAADLGLFATNLSNVRQNITFLEPNYTVVVFQGVNSDPTNSFDPSTGIFTVPLSGYYFFTGSVQFDNTILGIQINTTLLSQTAQGTIYCNQGDRIWMATTASVASGNQCSIVACTLQGWKVSNVLYFSIKRFFCSIIFNLRTVQMISSICY